MILTRLSKCVLLLAVFAVDSAFAAAEPTVDFPSHEVAGGTKVAFEFGSGSDLRGNVGYNYTVSQLVQLGGLAEYVYLKPKNASTGVSTLRLFFGPTFNITMPNAVLRLSDAYFAFIGAGFASVTGHTTTTNAAFTGAIGKRFTLLENIAFRPSVGFTKVTKSDTLITVTPVSFSVLF